MNSPEVILVDRNDMPIGVMEKLEAHEKGLLHRAVSVIIINSLGQVLLQRRCMDKYHSGGLWTNTCCSHPYPNESAEEAAYRRLEEEMGLKTQLDFLFSFEYRTEFGNGLIEHELDHVFLGVTDDIPRLDPREADDWEYKSVQDIKLDIQLNPAKYTTWFKLIMERLTPQLQMAV